MYVKGWTFFVSGNDGSGPVRRDPLEKFALEAIKEVMLDPHIYERLEKLWLDSLKKEPSQFEIERNSALRDLEACEKSIQSCVTAIETGGNLPSLINRLKELESQREKLKREIAAVDKIRTVVSDMSEAKKQISALLLNFEDRFANSPMEERKLLVKKIISRVTIDRKQNVARFVIRRLPAVTPEIEALYQNKKALTEVVSARSSGGKQF